jgi:thiamine kinase-like enzyme
MNFIFKVKKIIINVGFKHLIKTLIKNLYLNIFFKDIIFFNKLVSLQKYSEAYSYSIREKLLIKHTNSLDIIRKIAISSYFSGKKKEALKIFESRLNSFIGLTKKQLIQFSKEALTKNITFKSEYEYFAGYSNYGFILHKSEYLNILSKVVQKKNSFIKNKEIYFYEQIYQNINFFKEFTPQFISLQHDLKNRFFIINTEQIRGVKPDNNNVQSILEINKKIESINYSDSLKMLRPVGLDPDKLIARNIHKKSTHIDIFNQINNLLNSSKDQKLLNLIDNVKHIVVNSNLYKFINPEIHYAFCHNDFHKNNIIAVDNNICKVFDWNTYSVALRGWDMCYYFGNFEFEFDKVKELYIDKINHCEGENLIIAKIFYTYLQLYIWVLRLRSKPASDKMDDYFIPAINYIKNQHYKIKV